MTRLQKTFPFALFLLLLVSTVSATTLTDGADQLVAADSYGAELSSDGVDSVWMSVSPSGSLTDGVDSVHISPPFPAVVTTPSGGGGSMSPENFCAANNGTLRIVAGEILCVTPNGAIKPPVFANETFMNKLRQMFDQAIGQPLLLLGVAFVVWFIVYKRRKDKKEAEQRRERGEER